MNAAELMTIIESRINDTSADAAVVITRSLSELAAIVSESEYVAFCDRVFGNWG